MLARRGAATWSIVLLAACTAICGCCDAQAQTQPTTTAPAAPRKQFIPTKQILLTENHVKGVLAAAKAIRQIPDDVPENIEKLDAIARANGLGSYDEYKIVTQTIGLTCAGFDDVTKKYVGRVAAINTRIARIKVDDKMSASAKEGQLAQLDDQLEFSLPSVQYRSNIDLLAKSNYCNRVGKAALQPLS